MSMVTPMHVGPAGTRVRRLVVDGATVRIGPPALGSFFGIEFAHLTVGGAALRTGDLFASGTVSGPQPDQRGSFLELSWNGTEPITLADGTTRTFLADGDTVTIRASAPGPNGSTINLGEVTGTIQPPR